VTSGGGAAAVGDEFWVVENSDGTDTFAGLVVGGETEVEAEADGVAGVMAGTAAGFCNSGCPKTKADTGTIVGRWAGMS